MSLEKLQSVEARGLVKAYPGVVALDQASITIPGGSILGLLGKNGAGKSTMIKALAGVIQPDAGEILVDGVPTSIDNPHEAAALGFAFVHQEMADVPNLTVAENVLLGLGFPTLTGGFVRTKEMRKLAAASLARLEADIDPSALLSTLSIAQRRLVMIARGLAADARLFVLDEPTASLTEAEIDHLMRTLRTLKSEGVAVLYVSHRLDEIFDITDRVTIMRNGHAVFSAATADVTRAQVISHITGNAEAVETRTPHRSPSERKEVMRVEGMTLSGVVEDASFTLHAGEMLGLAGLVGAGRTELMRLIFGADRATSGRVFVHGKEVRIRSPRDAMAAGIVLLPEDRKSQGAVFSFSVRKNITLPTLGRHRSVKALPFPSRRRERDAAVDLVDRLRIKVPDVEHPAKFLSGGNQQKMVLAKWLDSGADIFIFDEPTHGIDVEGKEEVYDLMTKLAQNGTGVIFISSEFTEMVGTCSRVLVMRESRLVAEYEGDAITDTALVESCYSQ